LMTVLPLETVIEKFTLGKSIFSIPNHSITEGEIANITLFNPEGNSVFTKENILSKSKNSSFLGTNLKGKVYGILNQGKLILG
jgi:dihydroorotase